jgi:hypothetical protein
MARAAIMIVSKMGKRTGGTSQAGSVAVFVLIVVMVEIWVRPGQIAT